MVKRKRVVGNRERRGQEYGSGVGERGREEFNPWQPTNRQNSENLEKRTQAEIGYKLSTTKL